MRPFLTTILITLLAQPLWAGTTNRAKQFSPPPADGGHQEGYREGVYQGRKSSIDIETVRKIRDEGMGATAIARSLGIDRTSVYRVLKD